jgi:hypothetical protein
LLLFYSKPLRLGFLQTCRNKIRLKDIINLTKAEL